MERRRVGYALRGLSILAAVFAIVPLAVGGEDNYYVATNLVDPLQPVWDALDRIPREVSDHVVSLISAELDKKLQEKLQPLHNHLQEIQHHLDRMEDKINNSVNWFHDQIYQTLYPILHNRRQSFQPPAPENTIATAAALENITEHVIKINEKLGGVEGGDSCTTLVDKVSELMANSGGASKVCPASTTQPVSSASPGLVRDCSDIHWQQPQAPSGVYEIFPSLDYKDPVTSYCDMGDSSRLEEGGWTVILRRQNTSYGLVNFNRTWHEYRKGFGDPGEGEWWFGLYSLHALTYRQPFEVDLLLHDIEKGMFHATYTTFRVEDESHDYKLVLGGFKGNLTHDALTSKHNGAPFTTWDKDNDQWSGGNCGKSNGGGWWFDNCHFTTLTAPFPTSNDREARTIRWLEDDWLVLDDVTMKIRPFNYAKRFNTHSTP